VLFQFIHFTQLPLFLKGVVFVGDLHPCSRGLRVLEGGKFVAGPFYPSVANVNKRGIDG